MDARRGSLTAAYFAWYYRVMRALRCPAGMLQVVVTSTTENRWNGSCTPTTVSRQYKCPNIAIANCSCAHASNLKGT